MLEGAALVGLLKTAAELATQLVDWAKKGIQSAGWRKRLTAANRELLLRTADLAAIREVINLAEEAGYAGPELRATKHRLKQVVESGIDPSGRRVPVARTKKTSAKRKAKRSVAKKRVSARRTTATASRAPGKPRARTRP